MKAYKIRHITRNAEKEVMAALKARDYKIWVSGPQNVRLDDTAEDVKVVPGEGCTPADIKAGFCTVDVYGYSFTCDLTTGEWNYKMSKALRNKLEHIDGVLSGKMTEPNQLWEVWERANDIAREGDYMDYEADGLEPLSESSECQ